MKSKARVPDLGYSHTIKNMKRKRVNTREKKWGRESEGQGERVGGKGQEEEREGGE